MSNGERLSERIDRAMKSTGETASNIAGYLSSMQEIGIDLHIKSINALLMSRRLGQEGITLAVLAQHVTDVSRESDHFVNDVIEVIKKIQGSAHDLQDISHKKDAGRRQDSRSAGERVGRITGIYDRFMKESMEAFRHSVRLNQMLMHVESSLVFLDHMRSRIEGCIEDIDGLAVELSPYMNKDENAGNLSRLKNRYTMEIERNIHSRSLEGGDIPFDIRSDGDSDGLGDNVELF